MCYRRCQGNDESDFRGNGEAIRIKPSGEYNDVQIFQVTQIDFDSEKSIAGQVGTSISIRNIFQEFLVRLTYAKKHRVSILKLKNIILSLAFVWDVRFTLQFRGNRRHLI